MDVEDIKKTYETFRTDNGLIEVRIFNTLSGNENYSGIFDNEESLINEIKKFDRQPYNIYFIFNELKDATNGLPQINKFLRGAKAISDKNIKYRRWLFLDFDPIREGDVKDIASSDEETERAHQMALDVRRFLIQRGFKQPIVCFSGNGYHELYRIDNIECTDEVDNDIKNFLAYIADKFNNKYVDCDLKNKNASRLTKFYGSTSHKGGNTKERPYRQSKILVIPPKIEITEWSIIKSLADEYISNHQIDDKSKNSYNNFQSQSSFNIDDFLSRHNIEIYKDGIYNGERKIVLKECPFDSSHGKDSAIFISNNGAIKFTCFHNGCSDKTWKDLRLKYEPNAYDKKEYHAIPNQYENKNSRTKTIIKQEDESIGKKWLSLSDIPKMDISQLKIIKTGFTDLDSHIKGLILGEISILSGSNSSGKSSWLNSLSLNAINQGFKTALWSGELQAPILKMWILYNAAGKDHLTPSKIKDGTFYIKTDIIEKISKWTNDKLYIYNNKYGSKWEQVFYDMKEIVSQGVKLCILDNLFSLDIDLFNGDKNNKQKELILQLCSFAKENNIHIILVCHPRKQVSFLRKDDISGTSDLGNAVDNIFICHRVNNDFRNRASEFFGQTTASSYFNFGNVIEVAKNRMFGVVDYMCGMYYEIESRRFKNYERENIKYNWEENPIEQELPYENTIPFEPETEDDPPF